MAQVVIDNVDYCYPIAREAGSSDYWFDPASSTLYLNDVDQVTVDAVLSSQEYKRPTADEVRAECKRRMMLLFNARDERHLDILISNATREYLRIVDKGTSATSEQLIRLDQLKAADSAIELLRSRSNEMEVSRPTNFKEDSQWQ